MIDWIKNIGKEYPEFWKNYQTKFQKKPSRYVVLATETTGLSVQKDVILSLGAFAVHNDTIHIGDSFETIIAQYKYFHDNGISNEFTLESKMKKMSESDAIQAFVTYLENAILVGHRIDFDIEIINIALEKMGCGRLKNEIMDIDVMYRKLTDSNSKSFTLDELGEVYKIPKSDRNTAADDAYKIALLFLKLKSRLGIVSLTN